MVNPFQNPMAFVRSFFPVSNDQPSEQDIQSQTQAADEVSPLQKAGPQKVVVIHTKQVGTSGTKSNAGYTYEEYLNSLKGYQRADVFDEMRRSDSQIQMLLKAIKNPIRSAEWIINEAEDVPNAEAHKELVEHILFERLDWSKFLKESLTKFDFGHAVFEVIDEVVMNDPQFGDFNSIKKLAWRSPRTIHRWNLNKVTEDLESITQYSYGDLDAQVNIPARYLVVMSCDMEGSNYEGISYLRSCYGPWFRKNAYLKQNAVSIERFGGGVPVAEVPPNKENSDQFDRLIDVLDAYTTHSQNYITHPTGYKIDLKFGNYDPEKIENSIDREDIRMSKAFLAAFLELGMHGKGGSQSLGGELIKFFIEGIECEAKDIAESINKHIIPHIVKMNFGPQKKYPKINASGISEKATVEFANIIKALKDAGVLRPDEKLEEFIRDRYNLPTADEATRFQDQQTSDFNQKLPNIDINQPNNGRMTLAEAVRNMIR